jgi:hypothetical protein
MFSINAKKNAKAKEFLSHLLNVFLKLGFVSS